MLRGTIAALLLLLTSAASTQQLETAVSAVVKISGTRNGRQVQGSGFVVGLEGDRATIVTASHVIEGVQQIEVTFAADRTQSLPAGNVLGMDTGSPHGLAVFQVRGALPAGVTILSFEVESRPYLGDTLFLLGFPQMEIAPRTIPRALSGRSGTLLLIDQEVGEGFSGGPVLQGGKIVGVVTEVEGQTTYAVNAVVAHEALEGWGARLAGKGSTQGTNATSALPVLKACTLGQEMTENGITYVHICGGTFTMGSAENDPQFGDVEKPAHQVTLSEFWLGKTEITNEQYRRFRPDHKGDDSLPAAGIGWEDAKAACAFFGGRLPTEAEWEYAARAGNTSTWSFGNDEKRLGEYAWYSANSGNKPHAVGTKKPNPWNLYDMYGNIWEWVNDWYGQYLKSAQNDPTGPATGEYRVLRGGSFNDDSPGNLYSAIRAWIEPSKLFSNFGFRCARSSGRQP